MKEIEGQHWIVTKEESCLSDASTSTTFFLEYEPNFDKWRDILLATNDLSYSILTRSQRTLKFTPRASSSSQCPQGKDPSQSNKDTPKGTKNDFPQNNVVKPNSSSSFDIVQFCKSSSITISTRYHPKEITS